jgi:hypothetical protein
MKKVKLELNFPPDLKDEPIFYHICRKFNVTPVIIEASFSTHMGWALMTVEGEDAEMDKLFEYLKSKHVTVKHV